MSLLIGGMIVQTFSSTKVGYFIGSVLVFLTSFTDVLLYLFFILSKKRNDNFILFGLFLTLFIVSEILLFIINFIPLFYLDFTTGYKEISKYFPIFYIVTIIKFNIFPYALKNDEKRPKNSKYLTTVYIEAVAVSLVGFYFLFQLGYIILTLGLIALIGAKENVNVRYFYFGFGAGRYVTYRDKEREILELKKENAYQEKEPISIKTHITNALLNLKENCTLKLTVLIMAVSVIALFDFSGLGQDYYPLILLSLLVIAILPISIYATINASKTVKISTLVLTVFGSALLISSVVVLPLKIVSPYIIGFAPLITFATILLGYLSYLWSVDISKLAKIIITIIATILTLAFIMFTGGNIFENRYFIMPWIVYLTLNSLTVILTTKYVKNRSN